MTHLTCLQTTKNLFQIRLKTIENTATYGVIASVYFVKKCDLNKCCISLEVHYHRTYKGTVVNGCTVGPMSYVPKVTVLVL